MGAALIPQLASSSSGGPTSRTGDYELEKGVIDKAAQPGVQQFFNATPNAMVRFTRHARAPAREATVAAVL